VPELVRLETPRHAAGIAVRTNNSRERDPSTAKISQAWDQFFARDLLRTVAAADDPIALGVYTDYESDVSGDYTLVAAVAIPPEAPVPAGLSGVTIPPGRYVRFEGRGPLPAVVRETWLAVWTYFATDPPLERTYQTDFEEYRAADLAHIYIGVRLRRQR
jgi:predicted transcriptional regulator YdeE